MAYLNVNGVEYLVREGDARQMIRLIENRRRAVNADLLVDVIAVKREATVEFAGLASAGALFSPAQADALAAELIAGPVTITGDFGAFVARARDIGYVDIAERSVPSAPSFFRFVTATFDEV